MIRTPKVGDVCSDSENVYVVLEVKWNSLRCLLLDGVHFYPGTIYEWSLIVCKDKLVCEAQ